MAGVASGGSGDSRLYDEISSLLEGGATGEMLTEWRSSEQLENGTPSTSPPYWDTDDEDEDCGLRPSELYGKHTWKIDKFSQINKRELRSNAFEVGGYKWYILIYPQGCDVCNHLSLFLCVANHDKLLPGWSHFAQFTIAVVNKDPKKSKYSDTLHRFWKKEHDWGWKKFMELSKVMDGFIDADTLIIRAQVQVIREKSDRPFRCLDSQYRRELVRVYLTNVEQICRRFVEDKRSKLGKLIEDKARWSSFCAFWLEIDSKSRREMTRERTDSILRAVVKHFFIEKEVTSTLVMDSLYSGLRALEGQIKTKSEESPFPVVFVDQEMFVLIDDVLLLLERASLEPLPPKDDKGPQNRMKDGLGDDVSKESIERDERRLTELGRRTIEIFVLAHIFSKIEVAYQEAVALKRQEELIREEAVWLETEQKSKRGAAEKEKKSKKKQGKQKRNNRKVKDKGRDDNTIANALVKLQLENPDESKDSLVEESKAELEKLETFEDVSDVSDTVDLVSERESSPLNWETDTLEVLPLSEASGSGSSSISVLENGIRESNGSFRVVDDSSSTCSNDSVPSVKMNGSSKANSTLLNRENHKTPTSERKQRDRATSDISGSINEGYNRPSPDVGPQNGSSGSRKAESEPEVARESSQDRAKKVDPHKVKGQVISHRAELSSSKEQVNTHSPPKEKATAHSPPKEKATAHSPPKEKATAHSPPKEKATAHSPPKEKATAHSPPKEKATVHSPPKEKATVASSPSISSSKIVPPTIQAKLETKLTAPPAKISIKKPLSLSPSKPNENPSTQKAPVVSYPSSAPIVPSSRPTTPVVSMAQSRPFISRSMSSVTQHHYQSYRNAMMGTNNLTPPTSTPLAGPQSQSPNLIYPPMRPSQSSEFGMANRPPMQNDVHAPGLSNPVTDEFPHLDIINDLLDDESGNGNIEMGTSTSYQSFNLGPQYLNRQFSYPGDNGMTNNVFGRSRAYHNSYNSSSSGPFEATRDFFPQTNVGTFSSDGFFPNQWQLAGSDLSYLGTRSSDINGYTYHVPDYSNGYNNVFGPSNGK